MTLDFDPSDKPSSVGHHFIVGLSGSELNEADKRILGVLRPAGVLLLKRNFAHELPYKKWLEKLRQLLADVHSYAERDNMIISIDHEGGRVQRTPPPITAFPYAEKYARKATKVAEAMAVELKSLGVNLSFAPVADIHSNPQNPVIGARAFGSTANQVIDAALAFTAGLSKHEVIACAKHFPGHGDTVSDSHLELPVLGLSLAQLEDRELLPFRALIDKVPTIMTAHILFPKIDPDFPATLSRRILNDYLRSKLNFPGVIISDDLEMQAVAKAFLSPPTIGQALNAGCDMFIVAGNPTPDADKTISYGKNLVACLRNREVSEATIKQTFDRIKILFKSVKKYEVQELPADVFEQHHELVLDL